MSGGQQHPWPLSERWLKAAKILNERIAQDAAMGREDSFVQLRCFGQHLQADIMGIAMILIRKGIATPEEVADAFAEVMESMARAPRDWPSGN
jgi:hypothetical protein